MNHIPPHLFLSREDKDDVRNIGKQDFRSVLLHSMLSVSLNKNYEFEALGNKYLCEFSSSNFQPKSEL